ncbi:hypothetical protein FKW77_000147 [Venturia effusa]|uniref:Uncharacterized protein n=1 Tax=Venturia effusa TaxID=50376 RepID=A0A517LJI0_9PEZI|nr:hypothetical protein FKW77_000147 [Venturia effusa]
MSGSKEHAERENIDGADRDLRPRNALDPDAQDKNHAFVSLIRPGDPATSECPRFPKSGQMINKTTPSPKLRMPFPSTSPPDANQTTIPTTTPPCSHVNGRLAGPNLESTTPTNSSPNGLQGLLSSSRHSQAEPEVLSVTRPCLPSRSSYPRGIRPSLPVTTLGVTRTATQVLERGLSGQNEVIERMERDEEQLDGINEPRSPTTLTTQLSSNLGSFEHELRKTEQASQPVRNLAFRQGRFVPAGEGSDSQHINSPPAPEAKTPPVSFRDSVVFQALDAQQQAWIIDASAGGFCNPNNRQIELITAQRVRIRDFAFESWMKGLTQDVDADVAEFGTAENEPKSMDTVGPPTNLEPEWESSDIPLTAAATENDTKAETEELLREQSFRNIYGSFGFRQRMERQKWEEEHESSSDEDEWSGLILGGRMGYAS